MRLTYQCRFGRHRPVAEVVAGWKDNIPSIGADNLIPALSHNRLADAGAFGVQGAIRDADGNIIRHGENSRTEVGILITNQLKKQIFKNIMIDHRLSLYTDYINNFGNIDVNWELALDMTVNQYVKANIGVHVIYDDDIKATEEIDGVVVNQGPKIQLKQMIGVGLSYTF